MEKEGENEVPTKKIILKLSFKFLICKETAHEDKLSDWLSVWLFFLLFFYFLDSRIAKRGLPLRRQRMTEQYA